MLPEVLKPHPTKAWGFRLGLAAALEREGQDVDLDALVTSFALEAVKAGSVEPGEIESFMSGFAAGFAWADKEFGLGLDAERKMREAVENLKEVAA